MTDAQSLSVALGVTFQTISFFHVSTAFGGAVMTIAAFRVGGWW